MFYVGHEVFFHGVLRAGSCANNIQATYALRLNGDLVWMDGGKEIPGLPCAASAQLDHAPPS